MVLVLLIFLFSSAFSVHLILHFPTPSAPFLPYSPASCGVCCLRSSLHVVWGEQEVTTNPGALPVFLPAELALPFAVVGLILPLSCISTVDALQKRVLNTD